MNPYYERDGIVIYHGDCREVLPTLTADVLVTDPPYGIGLTRKRNDYRQSEAYDDGCSAEVAVKYADDPETVRALVASAIPLALSRVTRGVVFPGSAMLWVYPEPRSLGSVFIPNGAGRCAWGFVCSQPILFYGDDPLIANGCQPNGFKTEQPGREAFDHPCPKPIAWMRWAIMRASLDGETILDPFAGSGTTLRAALDLGHPAIGIEIEERYCEIAAKRLAQGVFDFRQRSETCLEIPPKAGSP